MTEPLPATPDSRQIRVFLSSTFRDFMQERDLLVKQVFQGLRRRAQERGVEVVDVDLRWGVTSDPYRLSSSQARNRWGRPVAGISVCG